jgi:phage terminase small subunit
MTFLLDIINDEHQEERLRIDAAKALLPFTHKKMGESGKKEDKHERAKKVSRRRFSSGLPPKVIPIK